MLPTGDAQAVADAFSPMFGWSVGLWPPLPASSLPIALRELADDVLESADIDDAEDRFESFLWSDAVLAKPAKASPPVAQSSALTDVVPWLVRSLGEGVRAEAEALAPLLSEIDRAVKSLRASFPARTENPTQPSDKSQKSMAAVTADLFRLPPVLGGPISGLLRASLTMGIISRAEERGMPTPTVIAAWLVRQLSSDLRALQPLVALASGGLLGLFKLVAVTLKEQLVLESVVQRARSAPRGKLAFESVDDDAP